jgi:hypothetical protein
MRTPRLTACLLVAISTLGTLASAQEKRPAGETASTQERDGATLRSLIVKSGEAFNASDPDALLSSYAPRRDPELSRRPRHGLRDARPRLGVAG